MGNRIDSLHKRAGEIVEQKNDLTGKSEVLSSDLEEIKGLLDEPLLDEDDISAERYLEQAISSDLQFVDSELQENNEKRTDALSETDEYISSLEENLKKLEEMKSVSDLGSSTESIGSTEHRLEELQAIRELLEEDGSFENIALETTGVSKGVDHARNSFVEYLSEKAKESSPDNADPILTEIKRSNNKQLANMVKYQHWAKDADFGDLDNRVAQEMVRTIYLTKKEFKDVEMNFIGSMQARNEKVKQMLIKDYLGRFKAVNPGKTDEELLPYVINSVENDMQKASLYKKGAIAQSCSINKPVTLIDKTLKQFNGIAINEDYGSSYEYFVSVKENEVRTGHKPVGCDNVKSTIDHELGHQIDHLLGASKDKIIIQAYNDFMLMTPSRQKDELSGYAAKNIHEFIAECWSEYKNNPKCREIAKSVAFRINQINGSKSIDQKILEPNIGQLEHN